MLVLEQLINDFVLFRHYTIEIGHNAPLRLPVNSSTVDLELRLSVVSKS